MEAFFRWAWGTRKEFGSKGARVLRSLDDPNELVLIFEWDDVEGARRFAQSDGLREVMHDAGVTGRPDVYFVDEIEQQPA